MFWFLLGRKMNLKYLSWNFTSLPIMWTHFFAEPDDNFLALEDYFFFFCATHNETAKNITYLHLIFIISFSSITFLGLDRQLTK